MATETASAKAHHTPARNPDVRHTSVTAHVVHSIAVNMSYAEMNALLTVLSRLSEFDVQPAEWQVITELRERVEEIT